ncbi:thermosome subunit alpha [Natronoarchaeum sp. GCM10025321]|uniref:thermosome subunit alpha n=1 Tax=Natronoarchaeum sp. GCM10025321 TaxID=3252684 RepID=UPI003615421A
MQRESSAASTTLSDHAIRVSGDDARSQNIQAGRALAETVRSTLGPNGRDKMIVGSDGAVVVTNDGTSILDRLEIDHPAAEAIIDVAASQNETIGDGTTSAVLLTGALLDEAEGLLDEGVHPASITAGYRRASDRALQYLEDAAHDIDTGDRSLLESVATTAITGRWDEDSTAFMAGLAVDGVRAVTTDGRVDRSDLLLRPVLGGSLRESTALDGVVIDMAQSSTTVSTRDLDAPRKLTDAGIAIVDAPLTIETAAAVSNVTVTDPDELERLRDHEAAVYREQVDRIVESGADVVFAQKSIDDAVRTLLASKGVLAVERTRRDELHALERATGARAVADTEELTPAHVGAAGSVERRSVAGTELTILTDCVDADPVSILLRGGTDHVLDETKRIVEDCLDVTELVLETGRVLPGGGAAEIGVARALRSDAAGVSGREQLAVRRFADALEAIPRTLATGAGADPIDAITALRQAHHEGRDDAGFDVHDRRVANMVDGGVLEPADLTCRAIEGASEAAVLLLRVDDLIAARRRESDDAGHDHDHGAGGLRSAGGGYPWTIGH